MNLQEKLSKKRFFITGNGKKLNISFVPALATQIYQDYMRCSINLGPELIEQQKILGDPELKQRLMLDNEALTEFNKKAEELKKKADEANDFGIEIITIVLESNDQNFKVTEREIFKRMSIDDMNRFIQEVCLPSREEKKK